MDQIVSFVEPSLSIIFSFILGVVTSLVATYIYAGQQRRTSSRSLRALFSFGKGEVLLVFPHRAREPSSIMPRMAIEDVFAMKNIIEILGHLRISNKIRDPGRLSDRDKQRNIITFGGEKVNEFTAEILKRLPPGKSFSFKPDPTNANRYFIQRGATTTYTSLSFDVSDDAGPHEERKDTGFVLKHVNPNNRDSIVVVIAGIRGIGTWGASDCLRKKAEEIYGKKRAGHGYKKTGGYVMMIEVTYKNFDILETAVIDFQDLDGP
jgi:hypothetical protein